MVKNLSNLKKSKIVIGFGRPYHFDSIQSKGWCLSFCVTPLKFSWQLIHSCAIHNSPFCCRNFQNIPIYTLVISFAAAQLTGDAKSGPCHVSKIEVGVMRKKERWKSLQYSYLKNHPILRILYTFRE